jgi:gliding motility-associated-like protein
MRKSYTSRFHGKVLLAIVLILSFTRLNAQTDISIGTGTTGSSGDAYPCPLQDFYEGSRMQYLYRASELIAAGMGPGNLTSIRYNVLALATTANVPALFAVENLQIKIGTTSTASLTATTWETVSTNVYGPSNYTPVLGMNTFTFATPFFWNGTDNIVIEICNGDASNTAGDAQWTGNPTIPWTTGLSFNGSHTHRLDNSGNMCTTPTTTQNGGDQTTRPNITFAWTPASACVGDPNPGTATATPLNVCLGQPITLNSTGVTVASGLTYQWQVSTNNIDWNDITGANTLLASATQIVTSWYRFRVICINTNDTMFTTPVQVTSPPLPGGTYTINKGAATTWPAVTTNANFQSFAEAYDAVKCGIASAVVFNVLSGSGPYNERLIMNAVPGTSDTKTITFNGNGNTISFASNDNAERAVIKLRGASFIIFDSLTIDASAGTYGYGVQLISDADSNIFRKCTIITNATATSQNYAGIVINGTEAGPIGAGNTLCDYNTFINNTVTGGYYGITLVATFAGGANGFNKFIKNDVKDFYLYGMYVNGSYNTVIEGNTFSRPARTTVGEFNGIYFTAQSNTARITKNRITNPFGGSPGNSANFFGINFNSSSASTGNDNVIANNLIYNVNGNGAIVGIGNTSSSNIQYLHNTISLDDITSTSASTARGFQQTGTAGAYYWFNNIVSIKRGGTGQKHCIYIGGGLPIGIDYNDYYLNAAGGTNFVGFFNGNKATIADWRTATAQEANSFSLNPVYTNEAAGNYEPANAGIDNRGIYIGIDDDIDSETRSQTTPDVGAYEFLPPPCSIPPVTGDAMLSAINVCQNVPVLFNLNIGAFGSGQTFQWQSSSDNVNFTDIGAPMMTPDTTMISTATLYYRVVSRCVSASSYSDTVLLTVNPAFPGGTYTINKGGISSYVPGVSGGNFLSFTDAKNAMASCGILGPVVFNVLSGSGPYIEQLRIDSIRGASAINTITFHGNGNTISASATNPNERAVIKLNAADHIRFDSLTIDASAGVYGYGVQLINNADSNIFRNCNIITSFAPSALSTNYAGIVINANDQGPTTPGNTLCDSNLFDRNIITGGYFGVTLVGNTGALLNDNTFTNNTIQEFYSTGMHIVATNNTLIEGNKFTRPTRTSSASPAYGVSVNTIASTNLRVSKNRFTEFYAGNLTSVGVMYAVYHNAAGPAAGSNHVISNNLLYKLDGNGPIYGLYNIASPNVNYYYNTVSIDNAASIATGPSAGFFQTGSAAGIQFKNNLITVKRGGTGTKHAIYLVGTAGDVESNYNNFYVNAPAGNNFLGFTGVNQATLANWQTATGDDANSLSVEPVYLDPANGNFKPAFLPLDDKGTPIADISTDILNQGRHATTPDIGAFEFDPPVCTGTPTAGTATATPNINICLESPIVLNLTGHSPVGTITFQWQHSPDGVNNWTNLGDVQYIPELSTVTTPNRFYRAIVSCNASSDTSTIVEVVLNPVVLTGTYTIDKGNTTTWPVGTNFNSFQDAVTAMLCGITGPVIFDIVPNTYTEQIRIPHIRNTSTVNTVTFRAQNGVASSAILTYNSTVAAANYTLKLDSAKYFIFKNMTISATNASFGRAVELTGTASYDSIYDCTISLPVVTSASNAVAGIYSASVTTLNNTILRNTISNGANGIYFGGLSNASISLPGHIIDSNIVSNAYSHGIFIQFANKIRVRGNTVNVTGAPATVTAGIYANYADSSFRITGNKVNISNVTTGPVYGLYVNNTRAEFSDSAIIASNTITAGAGNTNVVHGLAVAASKGMSVVNNVIAMNSGGAASTGLNNNNNVGRINYYNNSINLEVSVANSFAGYFQQAAANGYNIKNNIFSHQGGGRALYVDNPSFYSADYNMLYTTGASLVQVNTGTVLNFATLQQWKSTWNWDRFSIVYAPAFVSNSDLHPDLNNVNSWAMNGRGVQVRGNDHDFNGNYRPDLLTAGVPDMGAYEFYPNVLPTVLTATPATPATGITQSFTYGSDTVMKITWTGAAPPSVEVRRFSGDVPSGLPAGMDSMFFYTKVDIPGGSNYNYETKLYYVESWLGSIPQQQKLGLGRTTPSNAWVVGANSTVDVGKKEIKQNALIFLDRFTGLVNPFANPELDDENSNRGKDFWVGYQRSWDFSSGNSQEMILYFGAGDVPANVTVTIEGTSGTPWVRNYFVPANSSLSSDFIPKGGTDDARLNAEGLYDNKGIHITSDVPIVAYAHIYASTNSGATMLMPTNVWGYEYFSLNNRQSYSASGGIPSATAFHIVAKEDSTWIEINPSKNTTGGWTPNGGPRPNGSYLVKLNKGDAYQVLGGVLSGSEGLDLTGSYIKSVVNGQNECHPIAVFSGSTRTGLGCGTSAGGSGDLIIQQIFPYQAWGTKYATAPTSIETGPNATSNTQNKFRVMVKDPATVVKRNGIQLTGPPIDNRYYEFESATADYIESSKPVLVAQYMASNGACPNSGSDGDPEMFYLSPLQQAIKSTQFYRNDESSIDQNFITLVIPTEGLQTLKIDGINYQAYPATERYTYDHPNLLGYSVVTKKWIGGFGSSTVASEFPFTGIAYGTGSVESYGYNLGTLVKNLNNFSSVNNVLNLGTTSTDYTCQGALFTITALIPVEADSINWLVNGIPKLIPNTANIMQANPVAIDTVTINGIDYYQYALPQQFVFDTAGVFTIPIEIYSTEVESCDNKYLGNIIVQVLPAPKTNFSVDFSGPTACAGAIAEIEGDLITQNGIALNQWNWTLPNGSTVSGQNQTYTFPTAGVFPVILEGITADGCISKDTVNVEIHASPTVEVVEDSIGICAGNNITMNVANPVAGVTYNWYDVATGGTIIATGDVYSPTGVTPPQQFYVEAVGAGGCKSPTRAEVEVYSLSALPPTAVTVTASGPDFVTFSWPAVTGATSYQVSVNSGAFIASNGPAGLSHTVSGLGVLQSVSLAVKVINGCGESVSTPVSGCTNSTVGVATDSLAVCSGSNATFNVQNPAAGFTYTWYTEPTGGTSLATGTSFTATNITAPGIYYVQHQSPAGCVGTPRTRVAVGMLIPLPQQITVTADSIGVNAIRFRWSPVPNAVSYQVSVDGGPFITPSSGTTGLTHTVTGLAPMQEVTLIVKALGSISCQESISDPLKARTSGNEIFIPNTFTPNGDGLNDVLRVYGSIIKEMNFMVFNQWGEKIFESRNQLTGWDGTHRGKPQPSGVYIFAAKFVLLDGTVVNKSGAINLIR